MIGKSKPSLNVFAYYFTTTVMSQLSQKPLGEENNGFTLNLTHALTCKSPLDNNAQLHLVYTSTYY